MSTCPAGRVGNARRDTRSETGRFSPNKAATVGRAERCPKRLPPVFGATSGRGFLLLVTGVAVAASLLCGTPAAAAERIVLRNLQIIRDRPVETFDEDGVRLQGGMVIPWDEIERGTVAPQKQAAFDQMLKDLGESLYRIRRRLTVGDYVELAAPAEAVYPRYVGRNSKTAYMVWQATMWSRLAAGRREAALEPYLYCYEYSRRLGGRPVALPGNRRLKFDPATGMTPELLPVWFDRDAVKAAMPGVLKAAQQMRHPMPKGVRVYYATLAFAAGDPVRATEVLAAVDDRQGPLAELRDIAKAQGEVLAGRPGQSVRRLVLTLDQLAPANKPLALYWLGIARLQSGQERVRQEGILQLLHLPALYGKSHPALAAAGLYRAMLALEKQDNPAGSRALRGELLARYGQTYHADKARKQQDSPERNSAHESKPPEPKR